MCWRYLSPGHTPLSTHGTPRDSSPSLISLSLIVIHHHQSVAQRHRLHDCGRSCQQCAIHAVSPHPRTHTRTNRRASAHTLPTKTSSVHTVTRYARLAGAFCANLQRIASMVQAQSWRHLAVACPSRLPHITTAARILCPNAHARCGMREGAIFAVSPRGNRAITRPLAPTSPPVHAPAIGGPPPRCAR